MNEQIKKDLGLEKENLIKQLKLYTSEDPYKKGERSSSFESDDQISDSAEHDRIFATKTEVKARLKEVEYALERIDKNTWGICKNCGNKISPDRLLALPTALYCLDCSKIKK